MSWLENKYINLLSSRLHNFKRKGPNLYNFSCPFCNDLKSHPHQGRAYIYEKQGKLMFFCHYCTKTYNVPNFIKSIDYVLYEEYNLEKIKEDRSPEKLDLEDFVTKMKQPVFMKVGPLKELRKISQLEPSDPMKKFVINRKIPTEYHAKLFSCSNFMSWVNTIIPNKFPENALKYDERRLVIPFFDKNKNIHAFQGRSLKNNSIVKYITIVLNEETPKLYGLDTVNEKKDIVVQEAAFDSFFIPNSIATAGGDLVSAVKTLPKSKCIITLDNEPRARETINKIEKAISNGYRVCIWPNNIQEKDVNEMIMNGLSADYIEHVIKNNTYSDLIAKTKLSEWRKI